MKLVSLAAISLNQTPLDWPGNTARIKTGLDAARAEGIQIACFPELCLSGYGCEDMFKSPALRAETERSLLELLPFTKGLICAVGLPLSYRGLLYDTACLLSDGEIIGFSPKHNLAGDGIHYEPRWFAPWPRGLKAEVVLSGRTYPIGDYVFEFDDLRLGFEICEDAWAGRRPGGDMAAQQVDIILNPSASHFAFGKFEIRKRFVLEGARAFGVAYVYANLLGNEAGRAIYDGGSLIAEAGELLGVGSRFSFEDVSLTKAVVDIEQIRLKRPQSASLYGENAAPVYACLKARGVVALSSSRKNKLEIPSWERSAKIKEEEFTRAVSLALFDYLRKSRSQGFVVSLSGGADSTATAVLVSLMVSLGLESLGSSSFKEKLGYISELSSRSTVKELREQLLTCVYQASENSSETTRQAAEVVATSLGASFYSLSVQELVASYTRLGSEVLKKELNWDTHDTSLQNIQARARGPLVWLIANVKNALLLATSNRSEASVGYTTMDGDTCGGLSPIGGIDKAFLLNWLLWLEEGGMQGQEEMSFLSAVTSQRPTAELRPKERHQTDEDDLMPYEVLDRIERLAIRDKHSPAEVLSILATDYEQYQREQLVLWVKRYFTLWSQNQWKRERFAPCFHLDDQNLDPKTWCRFPILSGGFALELSELC